jgi:hypothetical protein
MITRPWVVESIISPSTRGSIVSSTRRLASSMSSSRPVSFHQPRTTCGSTRRPLSTRCSSAVSGAMRIPIASMPKNTTDLGYHPSFSSAA